MVCARGAGILICGTFCQMHRDFCQTRCNSVQSLDCDTLQDGALRRDIKVRRFCHQSVALLVGEKWSECRHVFKCRCDVFVAFFLTRTVRRDKAAKKYRDTEK